jgi:hypothetical protein
MEEDIVKFRTQKKKPIPFDFVLDVLEELEPVTRPMFGCMVAESARPRTHLRRVCK